MTAIQKFDATSAAARHAPPPFQSPAEVFEQFIRNFIGSVGSSQLFLGIIEPVVVVASDAVEDAAGVATVLHADHYCFTVTFLYPM